MYVWIAWFFKCITKKKKKKKKKKGGGGGGGGLPLPLHGGVCGGADSVIVAGECLRFWGVLLFGAGAGPRGGGSGARRG